MMRREHTRFIDNIKFNDLSCLQLALRWALGARLRDSNLEFYFIDGLVREMANRLDT